MDEREPWEPGVDLFDKLGGDVQGGDSNENFYNGPEPCREYLGERTWGKIECCEHKSR